MKLIVIHVEQNNVNFVKMDHFQPTKAEQHLSHKFLADKACEEANELNRVQNEIFSSLPTVPADDLAKLQKSTLKFAQPFYQAV